MAVRQGFCAGAPVDWWDLGPASATPVAAYLLVAPDAAGTLTAGGRRFAPVDHPLVLTAVPGDLAYSPLVRLVLVPVNARWAGERLPSVEAIDAAVAAGLVEAPQKIPWVRNYPVVLPTSRLEPAPGAAPLVPAEAYYQGRVVHAFDFVGLGQVFAPGTHLPVAAQYALRREGGEPISEILRAVDITGDGDANDTNDLFACAPGAVAASPLVRVVAVVVAADTRAIDTYQSSATSDLMDAAALFMDDRTTVDTAIVRGIQALDDVLDRPFVVRAEAR